MAKTLIVSDVHTLIEKADSIVNHESSDKVIWLGDYFDQWSDNVAIAEKTAIWLKGKLANPSNIMCLGNHDAAYAYCSNRYTECSGFNHAKNQIIHSILSYDELYSLKFYYAQDGILFSHAGLSMNIINRERLPRTYEQIVEELDKQEPIARACLKMGRNHWFYDVGYSRGGNKPNGGLTWDDFSDHTPTPFINICGHSPHERPDFCLRKPKGPRLIRLDTDEISSEDNKNINLKDYWWSLDLDTSLNHYAILEDSILTIKEVSWSGLGNKSVNYTIERFSQKID